VRLRIVNGASMSFFDIRIPGLAMTVVAADGQDVEPVTVDEFRIGAAEVYDVIVEPKDDRAYTIFAQAMDHTGYARATLAPAPGMSADIPPLDPPAMLSMADMGMPMSATTSDASHDMHMADATATPMPNSPWPAPHDMSHMDMTAPDASHDMHMAAPSTTGGAPAPAHDMAQVSDMSSKRPPKFGPNVDMVAAQPKTSLSDPGVGLRNNGRRVLTYADLRTIGGQNDPREPGREIRLHLTGHMQRYIWSFDGQKFSEAQPLRFNYGERLRVVLINDSMMNHPIHLHGMWSEVESPDGDFLFRKHTVVVQPGQQLSYRVSANALGRWAFHCHLLYHMEAGMFREVAVEGGP
jgi:CopA family copper-resistance protein